MKTSVVMKRELFGHQISQNSKTEFFSSTDLIRAGNAWRARNLMLPFQMKEWLRQKGTAEYVTKLQKRFGTVKVSARGRGHHTWVHPLLFIDMALAISPDLKIEVYQWLFDNLIAFRNDSGDSYREMCGALYQRSSNKSTFSREVAAISYKIKQKCGVEDWQTATEEQLKLRDKIHERIAVLASTMNNNKEAARIGIEYQQ